MAGYIDVCSRIGEGRPYESRSVDQALREMDTACIEQAWIHPPDVCVAVRNREGNDLIAETIANNPDRFVGCMVVNPWHGKEGLGELNRAFTRGLRILYLHPPVQGFQLSDPLVDPLIEWAIQHSAPIYAHTATPICAMPFQLAALARRHPKAKFIMGHMGYSDFWYDAAAAAQSSDNIWLETSFIDGDLLIESIKKLGADRFVFATASPLSGAKPEREKLLDLGLPEESLDKIMRSNAMRMLS